MKLHTLRSILSSPMLIMWPDLSQAERDKVHRARRELRHFRKQRRQNRKQWWLDAQC